MKDGRSTTNMAIVTILYVIAAILLRKVFFQIPGEASFSRAGEADQGHKDNAHFFSLDGDDGLHRCLLHKLTATVVVALHRNSTIELDIAIEDIAIEEEL